MVWGDYVYIDNKLTHTYVINDMMIRTLERDLKYLKEMNLKTVDVLMQLYDKTVRELRSEQIAHKNKMAEQHVYFQSEKKKNELFTNYYFTYSGGAQELTYSNHALRNHTLKALAERFGI